VFILILTIYWIPRRFLILCETIYPDVLLYDSKKIHSKDEKTIYLTFDDGPREGMKEILKILDEYGDDMKASFFIISSNINKDNRMMLINAIKNGHQMCNHGETDTMHAILKLSNLEKQIMNCKKELDKLYSETDVEQTRRFYRPGCGLFTQKMIDMVGRRNELNHTLTLGSVYPNDPIFCTPRLNFWYLKNHIKSGDIVILHDRKWTPPMLKLLLPWLKKEGYKSKILSSIQM